jgi:hypothetical protein
MPDKRQPDDQPIQSSGTKAAEGMPLIFISHDSRDAELAESFSRLLRSVSAGMLKSFRSSDRHGIEGIQYGDEWYKRLMERLADASDVVCLFTKRSLNRPWILFEAGVAKGKLDTPVHGVALGVPLDKVSTGPFYQFQNCQDDEDGLTGLVLQLLKKIPNAEPDNDAIALQVKSFKANVEDILARLDGGDIDAEPENAEVESTSGAKLFEEIKVMVRDLPSNLEDRLSENMGPFRRRLRRFHPMMFEEFMHMMPMKSPDPYLGLLIMASLLREDFPWIYELAMDAYRAARDGRKRIAEESLQRFRHVLEFTMHHPMMHEMFMSTKEGHMFIREFGHALEQAIDFCEKSPELERDLNK